jgi:histidyl-tRNA synthetase
MHDTLPDDMPIWHFLESTIINTLNNYGYREIRTPVLEKTELFQHSIGETSDIVSKEMYTFEDRNGDLLTMRPEGTASCVRAVIENAMVQSNYNRLWYYGPMFRHERPQKGRLRQFHQIGIEVFGIPGPDIDAEIIIMCARIWKALGLSGIKLEINTLGSPQARQAYRNELIKYFSDHKDQLDEDSLVRLDKNPMRILDSKNPDLKKLIQSAPQMSVTLDDESCEHFATLQGILDSVGIKYEINPRLVRGLDYYNRTVFEWITDKLGAQSAVCAGGRYDGMVEHFGGPPTPGIGFGLGLERLTLLLKDRDGDDIPSLDADVYFVIATEKAIPAAMQLAETLRDQLPGIRLTTHCGGGNFKKQFKKADKSGANIALVMGNDELEKQTVGIKSLRTDAEQQEVSWQVLPGKIREQMA